MWLVVMVEVMVCWWKYVGKRKKGDEVASGLKIP